MELTEWAKLQEELLKAQLGVVRDYLRSAEPGAHERKVPQGERMSQMRIITDILTSSRTPARGRDHPPGKEAVRGDAGQGIDGLGLE